jgi:hypothetical protein
MRIILIVIQLFVGLGALVPGYSLIQDPTGHNLGFPPELLKQTFFSNYLIPGLFLFVFNGLGNLFLALMGGLKWKHFFLGSLLMGLGLMFWISVQVLSINQLSWLQPSFFLIGLLETLVAWKAFKSI